MKTKSRKIPGIVFGSILLLLFFVWLGSFSNSKNNLEKLISLLGFDGQKALASEADIEEALDIIDITATDTMYVENDSGFPGDTLWITIGIKNTVRIAGFTGGIRYDTSRIVPLYALDIDTNMVVDTTVIPWDTTFVIDSAYAIFMEKTPERTASVFLEGYAWWTAGIFNRHLDTATFLTYVGFGRPSLPAGRGPVARIKFRVKPTAPEGPTNINWCASLGDITLPNNWPDTTGINTYIPKTRGGTFTVRSGGPPVNQCPVFAAMPSEFEVNEGATLNFSVTATDADEDTITLSMDPLPTGYTYSFPTKKGKGSVTQTFSFSPTFTQGPATIYATFRAKDEHACSTATTVRIDVIETAQDILIVSSEEGGVPGSSERMVPFIITNTIPIYGFQFTLRWDHTKVDVDSFARTDVIHGFSMYTNLGDSLGVATVLVFGLASQTIPAGIETVLYAAMSVEEDAPPGKVTLQLENAREAVNPGDPSQPLGMVHGMFTIDMFGDANIDTLVDIADVVSVVAYILSNISFTQRQFMAADVVPNDTINVADLVGIINIILGRWTGPSPSPYSDSEPMAIVRLDYEDLQPGTTGEVKVLADLEVPVAGAQIEINYDPEQLSFEAPRLSDWSDRFIAEYKDDKQGKLTALLYNLSNDPILPGEGSILSLPVTVSPNVLGKIKLEIGEVVLADENAVEIPVDDGKTSVPQAFELGQNYPNPFNPTTTIKYTLPSVGDGQQSLPTTLKIYNILGEVVRTLVDEPKSPDVYYEVWDGKDNQGNQVASGIYFYRLKAGEFSETKKMVMLK